VAGVFRSIPSRSRRRACSPTGSRLRALAAGLAWFRPKYTDPQAALRYCFVKTRLPVSLPVDAPAPAVGVIVSCPPFALTQNEYWVIVLVVVDVAVA